jgi:excisionase family DNA binding protein
MNPEMSTEVGEFYVLRCFMERFDEIRSKVLTVQEVSAYLRVHPSTIYRMLKKNQLPAFRVGSDWRFTVEAIDRWRSEVESGSLRGNNQNDDSHREDHHESR